MLTQAWGFWKIEITVWEASEGSVEGLALEILRSACRSPGPSLGEI